MSSYTIITNNPDVADKHPGITCYREGSVMDIFEAVRNAIHRGAQLISYPLSGSIKPNQTPYKSIMISSMYGPLEYKSLQIIEDAICVLRRLPEKQRNHDESILADFRIIDLDHISSALQS